MKYAAAAVWLLACVQPAAAQTPPRRMFVEATTIAGGAVTDLRPDEFEIREGGARREISAVTMVRRPMRLILIVDSTEGTRQPIGQIRRALIGFLEAVDPKHEVMLVLVGGTMHIRVRPTNTTDFRPVVAVVTTEGFESTQLINPQEIRHISDDALKRGGVLHAVRVLVLDTPELPSGHNATELPVSLMVARATDGQYTSTSPNGLRGVLQNLAIVINQGHDRTELDYQVEYASAPVKGRKPAPPDVRVTREGVRLNVISAP